MASLLWILLNFNYWKKIQRKLNFQNSLNFWILVEFLEINEFLWVFKFSLFLFHFINFNFLQNSVHFFTLPRMPLHVLPAHIPRFKSHSTTIIDAFKGSQVRMCSKMSFKFPRWNILPRALLALIVTNVIMSLHMTFIAGFRAMKGFSADVTNVGFQFVCDGTKRKEIFNKTWL